MWSLSTLVVDAHPSVDQNKQLHQNEMHSEPALYITPVKGTFRRLKFPPKKLPSSHQRLHFREATNAHSHWPPTETEMEHFAMSLTGSSRVFRDESKVLRFW